MRYKTLRHGFIYVFLHFARLFCFFFRARGIYEMSSFQLVGLFRKGRCKTAREHLIFNLRGDKMIRGTTPTLEFTLPFSSDDLSVAFVTLSQFGKVVIDRPLSQCKCDNNVLIVKLTQEETLKLNCDIKTEIQLRAKTKTGEALASDIFKVPTDRILKDGVI